MENITVDYMEAVIEEDIDKAIEFMKDAYLCATTCDSNCAVCERNKAHKMAIAALGMLKEYQAKTKHNI